MIGIVVPAHNEEDDIGACLASVLKASRCESLNREPVLIVVALDACTDATASVAISMGVITVEVNARNVGIARAAGAKRAIEAGARWLAFTDADSLVADDWLYAQLEQRSDAVCGTIEVRDWGDYGDQMRQQHRDTYTDADGHRHIHGANLGVAVTAYENVGGFRPLASSEDVGVGGRTCAEAARQLPGRRHHGWSPAPGAAIARRGALVKP